MSDTVFYHQLTSTNSPRQGQFHITKEELNMRQVPLVLFVETRDGVMPNGRRSTMFQLVGKTMDIYNPNKVLAFLYRSNDKHPLYLTLHEEMDSQWEDTNES